MKVSGNGQAKVLTAVELRQLFSDGLIKSRDRSSRPPTTFDCTLATVLLSVAFALTANDAQTVTVSDANLGNEQETWKREVLAQVKQGQEIKGATRLVAQRQQRIALVIGNGAYQDPLANPVNDATDVAKALRELGFEVILLQNKDLRAMEEAIEDFSRELRQGGVGVFYYAGHGVQVNGENYLVPLKAKLNRQKDVGYEAVPLGKVLNVMEEAETQVNIVIIDACRNNPFYRRWSSHSRGSGSVRGLAPVQSAEGTLIAFATAPGKFAEDGEGKNSPFTYHLLQHINTPKLPVELMFKKVRAAVVQETNRKQTPWEQSSLVGEFSFYPMQEQPKPPTQPSPSPTTAAVPKPTPSPSTPQIQPGTTLISKVTGVDYTRLRDLLEAGKWKEANTETTRAMRQEDIDNFPCEDLRIIDQLWLDYSDGKFGFSVQKDIYQNLGRTSEYNTDVWISFGERVGWRKGRKWLSYTELTYNLNAPRGQLPARTMEVYWEDENVSLLLEDFGSPAMYRELSRLWSRTVKCSL